MERHFLASCVITCTVWSLLSTVSIAQFIDTSSVARHQATGIVSDSAQTTKGQKLLYLFGAAFVYAGVDYIGYNLTRNDPTALTAYRVFQIAAQAAISWFLYDMCGLPTTIGFNLIWWTFGTDFMYYGYAELFNPGGGWESRGYLKRGVLSNKCNWAWWTPVGLLRGGRRDAFIAGDTLIAQSLIGTLLGVTVTLGF